MVYADALGLMLGAIALGAVHGVEPGHGWPVAASYALDKANKWLFGLAAGLVIGIGHLVSSIAMVGVFFYAKSYFELTQVNEPIALGSVDIGVWAGTVTVGGPVSLVAGVVLVALGVREYRHGHSHGHATDDGFSGADDEDHEAGHSHDHDDGHSHDHDDGHSHGHDDGHSHDHEAGHSHGHDDGHSHGHDDHSHTNDDDGHDGHSHDHSHTNDHGHSHDHGEHSHDRDRGLVGRLVFFLPFVGGHSHGHGDAEEAAERGMWGIAWFAFLLGFAHEEEFEIIALCAGSNYCLQLMTAYALTVIVGIVTLTLLLIAGYERFEERVAAYADYLPVFSAAVLVLMGLGFVTGLF